MLVLAFSVLGLLVGPHIQLMAVKKYNYNVIDAMKKSMKMNPIVFVSDLIYKLFFIVFIWKKSIWQIILEKFLQFHFCYIHGLWLLNDSHYELQDIFQHLSILHALSLSDDQDLAVLIWSNAFLILDQFRWLLILILCSAIALIILISFFKDFSLRNLSYHFLLIDYVKIHDRIILLI